MTNWTGIASLNLSMGLVMFGTNTFRIAPFARHLSEYSLGHILLIYAYALYAYEDIKIK